LGLASEARLPRRRRASVRDALARYRGAAEQDDDLTFVIVRML